MVDFSQSNGLDNLLSSKKKQPLVDPIVNSQKPITSGLDDKLSSTAQGWNLNYSSAANAIEQAGGIVFIDAGVQDYQTLIAGLKPGTEVAALDPTRNAVEQIGQYLAGRSGISSLHIISHGESGSLQLGGTKLGLDNLNDYANEIQHWRGALKPGGDILLYGCDVAEGEKGKTFVQKLSQLTGADVAASDDLTGNARLGGDWDLEFETGKIESSEISVAAYKQVLPGQTFTVSNTSDDVNVTGSLRKAIADANLTSGVADTIVFDSSTFATSQTITLSSELSITDDLTIQGTGANNLTISGNNASRVFNITDPTPNDGTPVNVTLDGLTITQGNSFNKGGGISNYGTLNLTNSTISGNMASYGGGIYSEGTLTITNSTIFGNQGDYGGGITGGSGTLNLANSTISGNQGDNGGGIYIGGFSSSSANLTNVTITNNTADKQEYGYGNGGGIYVLNISNSSASRVNLKNTIIAGNLDNSPPATSSTNQFQGIKNPDISEAGYGGFVSQGNNLIGDSTGSRGFTTVNGDIVGTTAQVIDAKLGPLQNNGGATQTHALLAGSPAINAGNNTDAPQYDQRGSGFARINNGNIDIGAFEFLPTQPPVITLSDTPLTYTEKANAIVIGSGASVSDDDSTNFKDGNLTVQFAQDATAQQSATTQQVATDDDVLNIATQGTAGISISNGAISYNNTEIASFTGGTGSAPLVINFNNDAATPAAVAALLQNITYQNTSENPPASRTVSFELNEADGTTKSTPATKTIDITPENDVPTLTLTPGATPPQPDPLSYTEQANPIAIDPTATVSDPDFGPPATDNEFSNFTNGTLRVRFTAGGAAEDVLNIIASQSISDAINLFSNNKISYNQQEIGSFTGGTNNQDFVITFNENANPEAVQALLRRISYSNTSDNPSATRTVSFELTDGDTGISGTKTKTINVTPVNDAAIVTLSSSTPISYTENAPPIRIDNAATIADVDYNRLNGSLNGGNLTVRFTAGGAAEDRLGIGVNGVYTDNIRVTGSTIISAGTNIGSFTGGSDGVTPLVISFNNNATPEAAQALLRNITYSNISNAPSTGDRTVSFVLTEGDGTTKSTQVNKTISVRPVNDPASVTLSNSTPISYTENNPATAIDNQATVSDIDSGNFNNGTLTVRFSQNGSAGDVLGIPSTGGITVVDNKISYNQQEIGTFTGGTNSQDLVIRFNVNASPTATQALLQNISYSNTSDNPSDASRTVSFELAEADGTRSTLVNKSISVTPVNDAPKITLSDQPLSYTENATAIAIDSTASVIDPDSTDFNSGTLRVEFTQGATNNDVLGIASQNTGISVSGSSINYQGIEIATFEGGTNGSTPLVIDFSNGNATPAAAQALLRSITYSNTSNNPSASRTVQFTLTDGDEGTSTAATKIINVTPENDAPTITGLSTQPLSYTENDPAKVIDSTATVADIDSANFDGGTLTVQFTEDSAADGDLLAIRNQGNNGIGVSTNNNIITYNGTEIGTFTGGTTYTNTFFPDKAAFDQTIAQPLVITFNSDATPEAAQALLRNITYSNSSENPITAPRTVSFTLSDGDGGTSDIASKTINVTAVNDAPSVTLSTGALSYTENDSAKVIDSTATVADFDSANFDGGSLTVQFTENGSAGDVLGIASSSSGNITVTQSNISYEGNQIATFTGGTNGSTPLVITFNSSATPEAAQALLRNITYNNTSDNSPATRVVRFVLSDGDGGTSEIANKTINVRAVNDSPELVNEIPNQTAPEDAVFNFQVPASTFTDVDGDTLTYNAILANGNPLPSWLRFDNVNGTFSGTPTNENVGALNIKVTATDSSNRSVSDIFALTVTNTNDAPTLVSENAIADQSATQDVPFNLQLTNNIFNDADQGDTLTYSATQVDAQGNSIPLPSWLTFNQATGTFSGTPTNENVGTLNIRLTATDNSNTTNATASDTFAITVGNTNDAPVFAENGIAPLEATEDQEFTFNVPSNAFTDADGDTLTIAASENLPSWLEYNQSTSTFAGTPANGDVTTQPITIGLSATDSNGATVNGSFALTVGNVNDAPVFAENGIAPQEATEDAQFSFTLPSSAFTDVDAQDTFTIAAENLPEWLTYDAATNTFSGTPANGDVTTQPITIGLSATDSNGTTVNGSFALSVANVNDAPTFDVSAIADQSATEDAQFSFTLPSDAFSDVDAQDTLTYSATLANDEELPDWLDFDDTNLTFSGTPLNEDVGSLDILVTATDSSDANATASDTFAISVENVNDAPVANIDEFRTDRAEPITISAANLLSNDTDVDGDSLSISSFSQPDNGTLIDNNDDTFTYTPDIYFQGADSFTYTVNDGNGGTATNSVDLTVNPTAGVFNQVQRDEFLQNGQNETGNFKALVFDEGFYLEQNPDVAQAVRNGVVSSGFDHFELYGYAEGRSPSILFDEAYYLEQNPDVAQAVRNRVVSSGFDHFERYGYAEGRNPSSLFDNSRYLADNSDVAQAVQAGVIPSGFDHYVRYGQFEGRQPNLQLFDESYYLANNPDVAQAVQAGIVRSGFDHFVRYGEAEGRNPSSLFDNSRYLAENPDVAQAVEAGIVRSACDHFIRYGKAEGRSAIG